MESSEMSTTEVGAVLGGLSMEEARTYLQTLYSLAHQAKEARCLRLRLQDLEVMAALEEKSNAMFEEWLFSLMPKG